MRTILFLEQQNWRGGAQRVLESVLGALPRGEFRPVVAFPGQGSFRAAIAARGVETLTIPFGAYSSGRKSVSEAVVFAVRSLYCGLRLAAVVRRTRAGLVYVNGPRCLPAGVLAAGLTRRPVLFHLHLILSRRLERRLVAFLARYVSRVVTCSQAAADALVQGNPRLARKVEVLYNPVSDLGDVPARVHRGDGEGAVSETSCVTVGMVGRITPLKGQDLLLKAVADLAPSIRERVRILIAGAPAPESPADLEYAEDLRVQATACGLRERVVWTGYLKDPGGLYAGIDVLVHPALAEAMPLAVLEALQQRVPVIASRAGGIPEIVDEGRNALLVPVGDVTALGAALEQFVTDGELRIRLQAGAQSGLDARFSRDAFASRILQLSGQETLANDPLPCCRHGL
jgi:glycosyltransferase involved in cell wall biosynthesis